MSHPSQVQPLPHPIQTAQKAPTSQRKSYTLKQKMEAVSLYEQYGMVEAVKRTRIDSRRIYDWKKVEFELENTPIREVRYRRRLDGGGRVPLFPEIEKRVTTWIIGEREQKHIVSISSAQLILLVQSQST